MRTVVYPTSVFDLGRMRHLDLLAMWCQLNPNGRERDGAVVAALSKERIIATITGRT